jgi:uncharacterized membrane protein HdeD (DUF308 family)
VLRTQKEGTMSRNADGFTFEMDGLARSWSWLVALGVLLMVLGLVCLGTARTATTVAILSFGWILVFSGVVWFVGAFQAQKWGGVFLYLLNAMLRGFCGYALLRHPDAGAEGITLLIAVLLVVGGAFRLVAAGLVQFPRWGWTAASGTVAIVLGFTLLGNWTASSTFFVGAAIGVDLILDGIALLAFANAVRGLRKIETSTA